MKKLMIFFCLLCSFVCLAKDIPHIWVDAEGYGNNESEALKNAFHEAVRKAVGFYLVAEKITIDDSSKSRIYANADALVLKHEVVAKEYLNNTLKLKIKAKVAKKIHTYLADRNKKKDITQTELIDVLRTKETYENAIKSMKIILKDFPNPFINREHTGRVRYADTANPSDDKYSIQYDILITVNNDAYLALTEKLCALFSNIAYRTAIYSDYELDRMKYDTFRQETGVFILSKYKLKSNFYILGTKKFSYYSLPKNICNIFSGLINVQSPALAVKFKDAAGDTFKMEYIRLKDSKLFLRAPVRIGNTIPYMIAPRIQRWSDCCQGLKITAISEFKPSEYQKLKSISIDIISGEKRYYECIIPKITYIKRECYDDVVYFRNTSSYYPGNKSINTNNAHRDIKRYRVTCTTCKGRGSIKKPIPNAPPYSDQFRSTMCIRCNGGGYRYY